MPELPPHARRIQHITPRRTNYAGTTSACAENTPICEFTIADSGNYLRMRGEYSKINSKPTLTRELPPHARRILKIIIGRMRGNGTTSACAENTMGQRMVSYRNGNYLRMRGEYRFSNPPSTLIAELPPHARRIPPGPDVKQITTGTTSACAENTYGPAIAHFAQRNYLRMRGEYAVLSIGAPYAEELPPHARRIRLCAPWFQQRRGTTSACAENTHHSWRVALA